MKSLRFAGNSQVEVIETPIPALEEGEMLVRIRVSALCGSEMGAFRAEGGMEGNSGHEFAGEVVDPNGQRGFAEGDRVGVHIIIGCGECRWCRADRAVLCEKRSFCSSAHAEYKNVPAHHCVKLPDDIDWPTGVLIAGDAMGVAYHVADRVGVRATDTVAVMGCGPIGLGNILLLQFYGARPIGVDVSPQRLELARQMGAVDVVDASDGDAVEKLRELTDGEGPDICYECTGKPAGIAMAFEACANSGKIGVVGEQQEACFNPSRDLIHKELTVYGAWYWRMSEFEPMVKLVRRGLDVTRLITHELPLEDAQVGYELMAAGKSGKSSSGSGDITGGDVTAGDVTDGDVTDGDTTAAVPEMK